jgi:hypothetical protein
MRRRGYSRLDPESVLWLTALFAAGTPHWYAAGTGSVSFLAHICAVTGLTAALWLAVEDRPGWGVGLAMGWAMLSRPTLILATPAVVALMLDSPDEEESATLAVATPWTRLAGYGLAALLAIAFLLAYNQARFANPLEFGYRWLQSQAPHLRERLATWGQFHWHYLPENLRVALLGLPILRSRPPFIWPDPNGLSVFVVTPTLFWLVQAVRKDRVVVALWASIVLVNVPLLLYHNTGWVQFGYRFALDWLPLAFMLLAIGLARITPLVRATIVLAWLVNLWGVVWWYARFY